MAYPIMATRIRISTMDTGSPFVAVSSGLGRPCPRPLQPPSKPAPPAVGTAPDPAVGRADEQACKPDPVPRRLAARGSATIHLGPPSPAGSSDLPAGSDGPPSNACAAPLGEPL